VTRSASLCNFCIFSAAISRRHEGDGQGLNYNPVKTLNDQREEIMSRKFKSRKWEPLSGNFVAMPHFVMESPDYLSLTGSSVRLLLDIAKQYNGKNNGKLLTSMAFMKTRGWKSSDTLTRAIRELDQAGFIHQTVKGHRPNRASWWALTWRSLDPDSRFDPGAHAAFKKFSFQHQPLQPKNTGLTPKT
jgi:hypothetical protein